MSKYQLKPGETLTTITPEMRRKRKKIDQGYHKKKKKKRKYAGLVTGRTDTGYDPVLAAYLVQSKDGKK